MVKFITGNQLKVDLYGRLLSKYDGIFTHQKLELTEIQSDELEIIVKAKAMEAYTQLKTPLFVQDATWSITALNGFPGPYMKYVNKVLSSEDILLLMENKANKEVILKDYFGCVDKEGKFSLIKAEFQATITENISGEGSSIDKLTVLDGSDETISNLTLDERINLLQKNQVWGVLAAWIKQNN